MAILSLVGHQMRNMVGIAGRMFSTLAEGSINIEMISQGASEINISCVIESRDAPKALNLIHQSCLQIKPEGVRGRGEPVVLFFFHFVRGLIVFGSGTLAVLMYTDMNDSRNFFSV
jgi:hypothetical protein